MQSQNIEQRYADEVTNLALDTMSKGKQALIFCNTRRGAEAQAEKIARGVKNVLQQDLEASALSVVSSPTKQCKRLAQCLKKGIAFHHAGLHAKQRALVETKFRSGEITIICSTPTLAMGLDMPAYRSIIRDLKRFSSGTSWGMADIPVLEFEQMSGRAGRPGKDDHGQAICIAKSAGDAERIVETYINGQPEEIYSKLAVEPVLRTYVLSLIASGLVRTLDDLQEFFDDTFYAFQYGDTEKLHAILDKMIGLLRDWEFLEGKQDDFVSADKVESGALDATRIGHRVAELYLDPLTAHHVLEALDLAEKKKLRTTPWGVLHLLSTTLEIRPLSNVRQKEYEILDQMLMEHEDELFVRPPDAYSHEYEEYLKSVKLTAVLSSWIAEEGEDAILESYNATPGELQAKRQIADWLLYSVVELCKLKKRHGLIADLQRIRTRLMHGVKEDVLPLLRLKGIGRKRARTLFRNGIRTLEDMRNVEVSTLRSLIGDRLSISVKEQVGQKVKPEDLKVKRRKRKGQVNLNDFSSP